MQPSPDGVRVDLITILEPPIEALDVSADEPAGAEQRVVGRPFDEHVVAAANERRDRQKVGARTSGGSRNSRRTDTVVPRDRVDQRLIPIVIAHAQVHRFTRAGHILERAGEQVAAGQINRRRRPGLGPVKVRRERKVRHCEGLADKRLNQ